MIEMFVGGARFFFTPEAVVLTSIGCALGLLIGVVPGLGPLLGIVLLLPIVYYLEPVAGMGMLIAVYVGGSAGGAVSAILLRIPGTPVAAATLLDGYPMAQKGRSADAIGIAMSASALGGAIGGVALIVGATTLANAALYFAPPEYFALTITGLVCIAFVSGDSPLKGFMCGAFGFLATTVGMDRFSGVYRFTFDSDGLLGGFHIIPVTVGMFALSEMFIQTELGGLDKRPNVQSVRASFRSVGTVLRHKANLVRSSLVGVGLGALPGAGGDISAFTSYAVAKASSKTPEEFGKGAEEGVVATEAANNACCGGALIPAFALGIPGAATAAVIMGALVLLGFLPGPMFFESNPDVIGGMFIAFIYSNASLLVLGILLTPLFVSVLRLKKKFLIPIVLLMATVGTYSLQSDVFNLWVMLGFGVFAYLLRKADYPLAPMILGVVLGPICEFNFRRSLVISAEDYAIFVERPISGTILAINALIIIWMVAPRSVRASVASAARRAARRRQD